MSTSATAASNHGRWPGRSVPPSGHGHLPHIAVLCLAIVPALCLGQSSGEGNTGDDQPAVAIKAAARVDANGRIVKGGSVLMRGGAIVEVGSELPVDVRTDVYPPGSVVCPGLIDCNSALGALGHLAELDAPVQADLDARGAFDRFSSQLRAALEAGVTTFALAPDDQNLVGGRIAICQTSGPDGKPRVLPEPGPLKLSISPATFKIDREPTSRTGALGMLRDTIEAARTDPDADPVLRDFARGRLVGFIATPTAADVLAAVGLRADYGLELVLIHDRDARLIAPQIEGVMGVIVGPYDLAASRRESVAGAIFDKAGVKVALAGGLPARSADSLRIGAAVATRAGMSPEAARRAITRTPAELLGIGNQRGIIEPERQGDLVVFSGDPLDLRSRVLAVYIGGRRVHAVATDPNRGGKP